MAKQNIQVYAPNKVKRKGVHAKTKHSKSKTSKNYKKPYASQGR